MPEEIKDGGHAFPTSAGTYTEYYPGMSLRDWFAGQALCGMLATDIKYKGEEVVIAESEHAASIAKHAYILSDAMLAERKRKPE